MLAKLARLTRSEISYAVAIAHSGDDSWSPSVHKEYLVAPKRYTFSMALLPVML